MFALGLRVSVSPRLRVFFLPCGATTGTASTPRMPIILVSNDDGIDSPTLVPLVRELQKLGSVRVVVPTVERSWIGKAITRFGAVHVTETTRGGIPMFAVSGSPADCVNLAVHRIFPDKPDMVVSGVNLGLNFSTAFLMSSGTVGAAIEAWIAGVPSIALSMAMPHDAYGLAGMQRIDALGDRPQSVAEVGADLTAALLREGFPPEVDLFTVNMPADATIATPREISRVTRSRYGALFAAGQNGGYEHSFEALWEIESAPDGDMEVFRRGAVSIAPLRLDLGAPVAEKLARALCTTGAKPEA